MLTLSLPVELVFLGALAYLLLAVAVAYALGRRWRSWSFWMDVITLTPMIPIAVLDLIFGVPKMLR